MPANVAQRTIVRTAVLIALLFVASSVAAAKTAELGVTKSATPDPVVVGDTVAFFVNVTNNGPDKSTNTVVKDALPAGVTFLSATSPCTHSAGIVTCNLPDMNSGATTALRINATAITAGEWTNRANVTNKEDDLVTTNNFANATFRIVTAPPTGVACEALQSAVRVSWNSVPQATTYSIYRAVGAGMFLFLANDTASPYDDTTAVQGQTYHYKLTSWSAGGESTESLECSALAIPFFPGAAAVTLGAVAMIGAAWRLRRRA